MCACTCVVTQHMTSTQRTTKSSRTWLMARRRVVGNEPKGDVGEYSTISRMNIICNNSREIKDFTKKPPLHDCPGEGAGELGVGKGGWVGGWDGGWDGSWGAQREGGIEDCGVGLHGKSVSRWKRKLMN